MRHVHRALPLVAGLLFCASAAARAPQDPTTPDELLVEVDERTVEAERLLTFAEGDVLRARTRWNGETWEQRVGREWIPVRGEIVEHRLEKDAIAESKRLAKGIKSKDHVRRTELARWMAGEGLYAEAVAQLDKVLRKAPEHEAVQRMLNETAIPLALSPEARADRALAVKELVIAGAQGSPATREVAARQLGTMGLDLETLVKIELSTPQYKRREFAALVARRMFRGELREELATRSILDGWTGVREQAAYGLRDAKDVAVVGPAIRALGSTNMQVRANAAEALGNMGYGAAVEPLMMRLAAASGGASGTRANFFSGLQTAYVMDFDVEIAQAASIADPIINVQPSGVIFDVRSTVQMTKVIEMRQIMGSLRHLTGQNIPDHPGKWQTWWDENADQWRAVDHAKAQKASQGVPPK